tara:strand:+ start:1585 stop:2316 length:732 start_codon:yes stop_codon:yes gene_type:complete
MLELSSFVKKQALIHAKDQFPKESCGLLQIVNGKQRYFKCKNIAQTPDEHFVLDPDCYETAEKIAPIIGLIHSHPLTPPDPSPADKVSCEKSNLIWFIVNPQTEQWASYKPEGFELGYIGRVFNHGVVDCYSLVRDFYKREFNIDLTDYYRRDRWWEGKQNLYMDNFAKEGFKEISLKEIKYGCVILINLESNKANHAAIYIGQENEDNNKILHHVQGRLSGIDAYDGYYLINTSKVLLHENC